MPVVPVPSGRNLVRLALCAILLLLVVILALPMAVCATVPSWRKDVLTFLTRVEALAATILGSEERAASAVLPSSRARGEDSEHLASESGVGP
jgi:hypothetical protein